MNELKNISNQTIIRRQNWLSEIVTLSGNFISDSSRVEQELIQEVDLGGPQAILDHLRLAGTIPEEYAHDSSEEKLYSKYTDALLAVTFRSLGIRSLVLTERADAADVECFTSDYAFVADAKAFRLTRTAKNQKDFKVQAMDGWRRDKKYAVVVAPLYQYPSTNSQIYQQAIVRNVCLLSYSHLAVLVRVASEIGQEEARRLLTSILTVADTLPPEKSSVSYWTTINGVFVHDRQEVASLWKNEKLANEEAIFYAKNEGLLYYKTLKDQIMNMSHDEAIERLLSVSKVSSKTTLLSRMSDNGLINLA